MATFEPPSEKSGTVYTVLGPKDASNTGHILPHEHLSMTFQFMYVPPEEKEAKMKDAAFSLENLGWIRQNPYSHQLNMKFDDNMTRESVLEEMATFQENGGGTIVENSTHGLHRDLTFLQEVSLKTGVDIVAGTGFYIAASQTKSMLTKTTEELANIMRDELPFDLKKDMRGVCGIIGELGCSWPLHAFEKKVLQAAAEVQQQCKCPVMIHPGRNSDAPFEIVRIFSEAGGILNKTVMAHLERTLLDDDDLLEFAKLGTFNEFDLFGIETSHYQFSESIDMPSDAQRIQKIKLLVDGGYEDKILISHDIHTKHRLKRFGGHGFVHILRNVVPKMKKRGLDQTAIDKFLTHNPKKWLAWYT